ncbi:hypothetical protein CAC42_3642 [Sphaceloma murrayae]|uniref:Uncharacterized protein n=1 Tax=Sphaceloma murrayae TaxID=2082308 RepID=A0A2K1QPW7_9PEZI|nr:hypothetical protein CAC42_3642 [Sphaceloma murrayae]
MPNQGNPAELNPVAGTESVNTYDSNTDSNTALPFPTPRDSTVLQTPATSSSALPFHTAGSLDRLLAQLSILVRPTLSESPASGSLALAQSSPNVLNGTSVPLPTKLEQMLRGYFRTTPEPILARVVIVEIVQTFKQLSYLLIHCAGSRFACSGDSTQVCPMVANATSVVQWLSDNIALAHPLQLRQSEPRTLKIYLHARLRDLLVYLQATYREQTGILDFAQLAVLDRDVEALLACQSPQRNRGRHGP